MHLQLRPAIDVAHDFPERQHSAHRPVVPFHRGGGQRPLHVGVQPLGGGAKAKLGEVARQRARAEAEQVDGEAAVQLALVVPG